ncbi:MAG: DUF3868 domain-containing protein [Bacteroides sp.]|nr:DUF3868 domain-containing protein [Bacteroides sp.]
MKIYTKIYAIIALLYCVVPVALAQNVYQGDLQFNNLHTSRQNDELVVKVDLDISFIDLNSQRVILLTPVLRSNNQSNEHYFDPIIIAGSIRDKVIERNPNLYNFKPEEALIYVIRKNGKEQSFPVELHVPFDKWMYESKLYFEEYVSGCAQCEIGSREHLIADGVVAPPFEPSYNLQYVTPAVEEIKDRKENYAARLNFRVGRSELVRDFGNNASVLQEVDQKVTDIRTDQNLTFQDMTVTGYASPEGNYNSNMELSRGRTHSFVNYLTSAHQIDPKRIKTYWKGEDWEGLRKSVDTSFLADKASVIRIIDEFSDINRRKQALQTLNGGQTYRILLAEYYPPLRRIEYTLAYIVRPFNVEEAKEVIKTKPQHLSLNEMFLVAQTYQEGTKEFERIFDIAVTLYPDNSDALVNASVQDIQIGAVDRAIERLTGLDSAEALNNLGVAYAKKENYIRAEECFQRAAQMGNKVAQDNKNQLDRFLQEK